MVVDSDAAVVVSHANAYMPICAHVGLIVRDIKEFLHTNICLSVSHVPRLENRVAHWLAKYVLTLGDNLFRMERYPRCAGDVVLANSHVAL